MNVAPMILRFCSGSVTPASRSRNSVDASTNTSGSCSRSKRFADLRGLVEPQHAVVDEDARQPVADGAVDEQRRDRRVDAAAQRADHAAVADLRADPRRRLLDERRHRPVAGAAADVVREVPEDLEAALGVHDLGVEQQRVERRARRRPSPRPARWRSSRRPRSPAARPRRSRRGSPRRAVRRARPRRARRCAVLGHVHRRVAELALRRRRDACRRACRSSAACRSRCRAPGCRASNTPGSHFGAPASDTLFGPPDRMMPTGCARANLLGRRVRRPDLRVDRQLAQPPRDQLRVLRPEIENDDGLMAHGRAGTAKDGAIRRYYNGVATASDHNML